MYNVPRVEYGISSFRDKIWPAATRKRFICYERKLFDSDYLYLTFIVHMYP